MPAPEPATLELLDRYRASMRRELARVLDAIERLPPEDASDRAKRWDLAIKLGRELGARDHMTAEELEPLTRHTPARAPRFTARERRDLASD